MAGKRAAAQAQTRQAVLDAAKAEFTEFGYEAATIRSIARRADRSTGAVFANWSGKAEIYKAIYGHAPFTPELGRALYMAGKRCVLDAPQGGSFDDLRGVIAHAEEA